MRLVDVRVLTSAATRISLKPRLVFCVKPTMIGEVRLLGLLILSAVCAGAATVDFDRQVRPIFESRCYECHGEKKHKAGVRFDQRDSVFHGGDSGKPLVLIGKSGESILV